MHARASIERQTRKKHLQCLSRLAPSVTRVVICVSPALRWTDEEKKIQLVVYYCRAKLEFLSDTETLATVRLIHSPKLSKSASSTFLRSFPSPALSPSTSQILTCIDREGLGRRRTGTRQGVSHSQSSLRSSSRLYIVSFSGLIRSCLFVTYAKPETTGRETLEESNAERKLESFRF